MKTNDTKSDCLKNVFNISKVLEKGNLKPQIEDNECVKTGNVEVFYNLYDKNKTHSLNVLNNLKPELTVIILS
jgi:hypothetical protein